MYECHLIKHTVMEDVSLDIEGFYLPKYVRVRRIMDQFAVCTATTPAVLLARYAMFRQ